MNPQPVSLADELRKLVERWRDTGPSGVKELPQDDKEGTNFLYNNGLVDAGCACADELSALLKQHAVVEPQETMLERFLRLFGSDLTGKPEDIDFVEEAGEIYNYGFEMAHALRACGHSVGDFRDPGYIPGQPNTYTGAESCIGCERERAHAAEQPKLTENARLATKLLAVPPPQWQYAEIQDLAKRVLAAPVAPLPPRSIELNLGQAQQLLDFFGGDDTLVSLTKDAEGLKAYYSEYPDEGSILLSPDAPGEQPPEVNSRSQQKRIAAMKGEPAPKFAPPAPPAQERASDDEFIALARLILHRPVCDSWPTIKAHFERMLATAAKQAREEAAKWLLYVNPEATDIAKDIMESDISAAQTDNDVDRIWEDLFPIVAQPAPPSDREEGKK